MYVDANTSKVHTASTLSPKGFTSMQAFKIVSFASVHYMPYTHTLYYVGTFTYHQCFDILAVRQLWFLQVHTEQRCLIKVRGPRTQTSIFWMKWLQHENGCNTFLWKGSSYLQDLSYKHNHWKSFLINMITILCSPPLFLTMSSSKKCHLCFTPTTCSSPTA